MADPSSNAVLIAEPQPVQARWVDTVSSRISDVRLPSLSDSCTYSPETLSLNFDQNVSAKLRRACDSNELSIFIFLMTTFEIGLARYLHESEVVVVAPLMKNIHEDPAMWLPFRSRVEFERPFRDLLFEVRDHVVDTYTDPPMFLPTLTDTVPSRYVMWSIALHASVVARESITQLEPDLALEVETGLECIRTNVTFNGARFGADTIKRFCKIFAALVDQTLADPTTLIGELQLFPSADETFIPPAVVTGDAQQRPKGLVCLFEEQVNQTPDAIAVFSLLKFENIYDHSSPYWVQEQITYSALNRRANQLARLLHRRGIQSGGIVGLLVSDPVQKAIAVFGVLKARAAYLAIDPDSLDKQTSHALTASGAKIILTDVPRIANSQFIPPGAIKVIQLDDLELDTSSGENLDSYPSLDDPAYIALTSGTTGRPKAAVIDHAGILNAAAWRVSNYEYCKEDVTLGVLSYSFDAFAAGFFSTLISGGSIVIVADHLLADLEYLRRAIVSFGVTILILVPSVWAELALLITPEDLKNLRVLILGGESAKKELLEATAQLAPDMIIANEYGPTETSVITTCQIPINPYNPRIIGKPIHNVQISAMDDSGRQLPVDCVGELFISGPGVARGYLNDPELSCKHFGVTADGSRYYKTGDLGRCLSDGTVEFIGRLDHQLKIRGRRVDLAAIESVLRNENGVLDVAVREFNGNHAEASAKLAHEIRSCAYVVLNGQIDLSSLKARLSTDLPRHLIPDYVIQLISLPRNEDGSLIERSLPPPDDPELLKENEEGPVTPTEIRLARLYAEVLMTPEELITRRANFFQFGGHSLKVTQLVARIHTEFKVNFLISTVFDNPELLELANKIDQKLQNSRNR